jgi:glucokinase
MSNCLLADIGGTRARFALQSGSRVGPIESMATGEYASAIDAIRHFLNQQHDAASVDSAVIAAAGPVEGGRCALTNARWILETDELKRTFGWRAVNIVNDLEALAWIAPLLGPSDVQSVGRGSEVAAEPVAVIAPGTGLGMACFIPGGDRERVLASEGGHATLAATDAGEAAIIEVLGRRYGHVSAERVLSGPGLVNLYGALGELEGSDEQLLTAERITRAALDGSSARARQALDTFCSFLGSVAGSAALMFRATGGVLIAGGIVPRIVDYLPRSNFRARFESKGRFRAYLEGVSTRVIMRSDPAFLGLQALAQRSCIEPPRKS